MGLQWAWSSNQNITFFECLVHFAEMVLYCKDAVIWRMILISNGPFLSHLPLLWCSIVFNEKTFDYFSTVIVSIPNLSQFFSNWLGSGYCTQLSSIADNRSLQEIEATPFAENLLITLFYPHNWGALFQVGLHHLKDLFFTIYNEDHVIYILWFM